MSKYLFSLIIPTYNAERFLENCLNSIIEQTYTNYEVIIINDGSSDNTAKICNTYCQKYNQLKLYNQTNNGVSSARNKGLDLAKGEYLIFIDADDTIEKNALEETYKILQEKTFDTLIWNFRIIEDSKKQQIGLNLKNESFLSAKELFKNNVRHFACWSYVFSKDLINKHSLRFKEDLKMSEDRVFIHEYLENAQNIHTISQILYSHNNEKTSACNSNFTIKKSLDQLKAANYLLRIENKKNKDYIKQTILNCIDNFTLSIQRLNSNEKFNLLQKEIRKTIIKDLSLIKKRPTLLFWFVSIRTTLKLKKWINY